MMSTLEGMKSVIGDKELTSLKSSLSKLDRHS